MEPAVRGPLRRDAIVKVAREMVGKGSLEDLSLRRLASHLGVTAPALYAHVRSKQDLLRAMAGAEFDCLIDELERAEDTDPVSSLKRQGEAFLRLAWDEPEIFRVMFLYPPQLGVTAAPEEVMLPAASRAYEMSASAFKEAVAEGSMQGEPRIMALVFWSGIQGAGAVFAPQVVPEPRLAEELITEVPARLVEVYRRID